ncbi:hypothetical protein D3C75_555760 [compost metagenome]
MQCRYSVDTVARYNRQMGHADLIIMNDRHLVYPLLVPGVLAHQLTAEPGIDLLDNEENTRQQLSHHPHRPFFQRFAKNGMVGVRDHPRRHAPGLLPAYAVHIHQYPHQLGNNQCRVRIIDMQCNLVRKRFNRNPCFAERPQNTLKS